VLVARAHRRRTASSSAVLQPDSLFNYTGNNNNTSDSIHSQYTPRRSQRTADDTGDIEDAMESIEPAPLDLPRHIAFICDGNSRWAKRKSLPESMGHVAGADSMVHMIKALQRWPLSSAGTKTQQQQTDRKSHRRIEYCTLFAFSTENWSRPIPEITALFRLIERTAARYRRHDSILGGRVRIELLGDLDDGRIPEGARRELRALEAESREACGNTAIEKGDGDLGNDVLTICLAINYGGRADLLQAAQSLARSIASGEVSADDAPLDESQITNRLRTSRMPDPDLIVRTGGERRLSNFLLWEAAYAELYFADVLWPDFDEGALEEALDWYSKRKRRFGGRR